MTNTEKRKLLKESLYKNEGILSLVPAWVPRTFIIPGGRLKLDRRDLYPLGIDRGGIDERWLASTTNADNGPETPEDEGLSYIAMDGKKLLLLSEAIELEGNLILGKETMEKYGGWKVLTKFFDNLGPIPHHLHQNDEQVKPLGRRGKPEAYYFPRQLNFTSNNFPYTSFGLCPGTTKQDIRRCLERWNEGDNGVLNYAQAYKLEPGTGWWVPPCILHAPGSLVAYEIQGPSDVFAMFQSMVEDRPIPWDFLVHDVPEDKRYDLDFIVELIDWSANLDEHFKKNHYLSPIPTADTKEEGYQEMWITYGTGDIFSGKELTVFSDTSVIIKDNGAYGLVVIQGHGSVGKMAVESPTLIRYNDLTHDELFVCSDAARRGIRVTNTGHEDLVILKHFGPGTNPDAPGIER